MVEKFMSQLPVKKWDLEWIPQKIWKNYAKLYSILFLMFISNAYAAKVEVMIEGLDEELLKNVKAYLSLEQQKNHPRLSDFQIRRFHHKATEEIKLALQPLGYYHPEIHSELKSPENGQDIFHAFYKVNAGEPVVIKEIKLEITSEGLIDKAFEIVKKEFPVKINQILNHATYDKARQNLQDLAKDRGYFDAQFAEKTLDIDDEQNTASIRLYLNTGRRYQFGEITFQQNTFNEEFLKTYLNFGKGDFYLLEKITELRRNLADSGYFSEIDIQTGKAEQNSYQLPITIKLEPRNKNRYKFRLGYGTDTGIRIAADWERRYLNDKGHRIETGIVGAQNNQQYGGKASYIIPNNVTQEDSWETTLNYQAKNISGDLLIKQLATDLELPLNYTTNSRRSSFSLKLSKHHRRELFGFKLKETLSTEYFDEQLNLLKTLDESSKNLVQQDFNHLSSILNSHYRLIIPSMRWNWLETDNKVYSKRARQLQLNIQGAGEMLGSNTSFAQLQLSGKFIEGLGNKGRILAQVAMGFTKAKVAVDLKDIKLYKLPESLHLRTGGDYSVRGYEFEQLRGTSGLGAAYLFNSSLEYEHLIVDKWSVATFVDMGNVFEEMSKMKLKNSAGLGVRWQSPVGPVKIDIAWALQEPNKPYRIHFNIGPDFR
jgi:translocation and assembly module TamA